MRVVMRDELGYIKADTPCPDDRNFLAHCHMKRRMHVI
jgi:hypothetical protein